MVLVTIIADIKVPTLDVEVFRAKSAYVYNIKVWDVSTASAVVSNEPMTIVRLGMPDGTDTPENIVLLKTLLESAKVNLKPTGTVISLSKDIKTLMNNMASTGTALNVLPVYEEGKISFYFSEHLTTEQIVLLKDKLNKIFDVIV